MSVLQPLIQQATTVPHSSSADRPTVTRARAVRTALTESLPPWGVLVLESHHAPEFSMQWRTHDFLKVVYFLDGAGQFDIGDDMTSFSTGDVVVIPPGTRNRIRDAQGQPSSLYAGCVSDHVLRCDPDLMGRLQVRLLNGTHRRSTLVATLLRRMVFTQDRASASCSTDMLTDAWRLISAVVAMEQSPEHGDGPGVPPIESTDDRSSESERVADYIQQLSSTFLEATTIDAAAAELGLSRRTFTRLFREAAGTTWLQFVRQLGIDHAANLLRDTELPITSVAFESGFADLSTFYRRFSKSTGMSPAAYRAANR